MRKPKRKYNRICKADFVDGMVVLSKGNKLVALMSLKAYKQLKDS